MSTKILDAILWRSYLTSTSDALWGSRNNQYYLDLPASNFEDFFGPNAEPSQDEQGNTLVSIWLEQFDGSEPVGKYQIKFKKLRGEAARGGSWNMNGQHSHYAYALWQKTRGPLMPFSEMPRLEREQNFIVIARDIDSLFHGRWIRPEDFATLPEAIRNLLKAKPAGWSKL